MLNNRPTWALIANILIGDCIAQSDNINKSLTTNTFIQSWNPAMNGKHNLPMDLQRMISVAEKYIVNLDALTIPEKAKKALPAWYHIASNNLPRGCNQRKAKKHLQSNHPTKSVSDKLKMIERLLPFSKLLAQLPLHNFLS